MAYAIAGRKTGKHRALVALLTLVAVMLAGTVSASAEEPTKTSILITEDTGSLRPPVPGYTFIDKTIDVDYRVGTVTLASSPDGARDTVVDDEIIIDVVRPDGTTQTFAHDYSFGCSGNRWAQPFDLTSKFAPGVNKVRFRMKDRCGFNMSSSPMYLVLDAPPAPVPLPEIASIVPDAPSPTDVLLTRGVTITPVNNGVAIHHFEYGWAPAEGSPAAPTKRTQQSTAAHARLNYGVAAPDSDWLLFARGITSDGAVGNWSAPTRVHTPKAPQLIALGDSITSGHHNDAGDNGQTTCEDATYSYAGAFAQRWFGALPPQWRTANQYTNLAFSGFATQPRAGIQGSVVAGGKNACQQERIPSPLDNAAPRLSTSSGSWNRIVITAGANDTNWVDMVKTLVTRQLAAEAFGLAQNASQGRPKYGSLTEQQCQQIITRRWNGTQPAVQTSITSGVGKIVEGLRFADPSVKITWLGYYNIAGTGLSRVDAKLPPRVPVTCQKPIDQALAKLHQTIQAGLPADTAFVPSDPAMRGNAAHFQMVYLPTEILHHSPTNPPGWPHPTRAGGEAIAALMDPQ